MFCTKCGSKNEEGVKFCVVCGHEMNTEEATDKQNESAKKRNLRDWMKLFFKGVLILIGISVVFSILAGVYYWYQNLPREVNEIAGIQLGMVPVEVTLAKGKPDGESVGDDGKLRYIYVDAYKTPELFIKFANSSGSDGVLSVCSFEYFHDVFGLGEYDSLDRVVDKLGEPTARSISAEGTQQFITYSQYNVAFLLTENEVRQVCVTHEEKVSFIEEY